MTTTHDSLGRRLPTTRISTGTRVGVTERRLLWFERLNWYGPLPTSFLIAYSRLFGFKNDKRAREDLTLLATEEDTPYGGPLLFRPPQQFVSLYHPRNQQLVYDVNDRSVRALKAAGRYIDMGHNDHFMHRFMKACCMASIELGILKLAKEGADLRFIPQHELVKDPRIMVPVDDPEHPKLLVPDYLFAIDYGGKRRHFAVEVSRATETNRTDNFDRKSALKNTLQYAHLIGGGMYRDLYGFNNLMLLNIISNESNMNNVASIVNEVAKGPRNPDGRNNYMLFKSIPDFTRPFMPPAPMFDLVTDPWLRVGHDPFFVNAA